MGVLLANAATEGVGAALTTLNSNYTQTTTGRPPGGAAPGGATTTPDTATSRPLIV